MIRTLLLVSSLFAVGSANAAVFGTEGGNGGDPIGLEFKADVLHAISLLQEQQATLPVSFSSLQRAASDAQVIVVDTPLSVVYANQVQISASANYAQGNVIRVNRTAWNNILSLRLKEALALHEVLSLVGVEGTGVYTYSQKYAAEINVANAETIAAAVSITPCLPASQNAGRLFAMLEEPTTTAADLQSFLQQKTVDANALNEHCESFAMDVAYQKRKDLLDVLFQNLHIDINHSQNTRLPLNFQRSLYAYALYYGSWEIIQDLRARGGSLNEMMKAKIFPDGTEDLQVAAGGGNSPAVLQALVAGGDQINHANAAKQTALMSASSAKNGVATIEFLLQNRANVNARDSKGLTSLMYLAANKWNPPGDLVSKYVAAGADVNAINSEGESVVSYAARNPDLLRALVDAGAKLNVKTKDGRTFLTMSLLDLSPEMLRFVLTHGGGDDLSDPAGDPLLCMAIGQVPTDSLRALIEAGASPNDTFKSKGIAGAPCLENPAFETNIDAAKLFLSAGAQVNAQDSKGFTALNAIAANGEAALDLMRVFLENGADPNLPEKVKGTTPLMRAADRSTAVTLAMAGADLNRADHDGNTPLIWAASGAPADLVSYLVQAGASKTVRNHAGLSAYDVAVIKRRTDDIKQLLFIGNSHPNAPARPSHPARPARPVPHKPAPHHGGPSNGGGWNSGGAIGIPGERPPAEDPDPVTPPGQQCASGSCQCSNGTIAVPGQVCQ